MKNIKKFNWKNSIGKNSIGKIQLEKFNWREELTNLYF
jgi:hypothetical protein